MKKFLTSLFLTFCLISSGVSIKVYNVTAHRYTSQPIVSHSQGSHFTYNYNAAAYDYQGEINLLVRSQNVENQSNPYSVGPSYLTVSSVSFNSETQPQAEQTEYLGLVPNNTTEQCGTEDPRIAYSNGTYYLFYTAYNCTNAMLSLATSPTPQDPESWIRYGYVFPEKNWSKSAAALFANQENKLTQHYLFWGDSSNPPGGIGIATSDDGIHWSDTGSYLIQTRSIAWDSDLVEGGPPPVQLSTGDFLFLYNSARKGYPSVKPNWELQYNIGFVILSGSNPTQVIQRSLLPLLSPVLSWEIGNTTSYLTPDVVFIEGLVPDPNPCPQGFDCFFGVYGAADSNLGSVRIMVGLVADDETGEEGYTFSQMEIEIQSIDFS